MKGIIYCRVSSQEQVQGTSLEGQKEACLTYAEARGIKVEKIFIEKGESATAANRTELIKVLDYCRDNKGEIGAFIVWKIDRFARNLTDHYGLQAQLIKYGTSLHSVTESMITEGGPAGRVLEAVLAGFAQFENDIRKQRCEGGMQRKIAEGIWPWQPPIGYTHSKKLTDRRKIRPDEPDAERFYLLQRGLKEYAKGTHGIISLTALLNSWGLKTRTGIPMSKQFVEKILKDKFYAGILMNPWTKEEHRGLHLPMITVEEYERIQFIKTGLSRNRAAQRRSVHPDFPLRKTALCVCLRPLTGSWQTGRYKKYAYYHCHNPHCERENASVPKAELEEAFIGLLNRITPDEKFLRFFQAVMVDCWKDKHALAEQERKNYELALRRLETQKRELAFMRLNKEISPEEFTRMKDGLENQIAGMRISANEAEIEELDVAVATEYAVQFIKKLARQWQDMGVERKQRLQKLVLPEGVVYDKNTKTFGTAVLGSIFKLNETVCESESDLVAAVRFERTTSGL